MSKRNFLSAAEIEVLEAAEAILSRVAEELDAKEVQVQLFRPDFARIGCSAYVVIGELDSYGNDMADALYRIFGEVAA